MGIPDLVARINYDRDELHRAREVLSKAGSTEDKVPWDDEDDVGGRIGGGLGARGGAWLGAALGTAIAPGIGTILGAVGGGVIGWIAGEELGEEIEEEIEKKIEPGHTQPSGNKGGFPSGIPAVVGPNDKKESTIRAIRKQNESAVTLANAGYKVEQLPESNKKDKEGKKNPDYRIEGQIFDCYAPTTTNVENIARRVRQKVASGQTRRIVLNLDGEDGKEEEVNLDELRRKFNNTNNGGKGGLLEIIIVKKGEIIDFYP